MTAYKTVLDKQTGELKKVTIGPKSDEEAIDLSDKAALRNLAIKTLVSVIQANPTALAVVPALKELFDRVDGKAPQQITLDAEIRKVTVNCNIRFTDELPLMENVTPVIEG